MYALFDRIYLCFGCEYKLRLALGFWPCCWSIDNVSSSILTCMDTSVDISTCVIGTSFDLHSSCFRCLEY